jgi:hypothetical protein
LESLAAVCARLHEGVVEDKLAIFMGEGQTRESAIAHVYASLLREVDPLVDPGHVCHD